VVPKLVSPELPPATGVKAATSSEPTVAPTNNDPVIGSDHPSDRGMPSSGQYSYGIADEVASWRAKLHEVFDVILPSLD